jgi:hypothetical protein
MSKQLPSRPSLEQLKKQAKSLLKGYRALDPNVLNLVREHHPRWRNSSETATRNARFTLADAQLVVAREYGFQTWSKMKTHAELHPLSPSRSDLCTKRLDGAISCASTLCSMHSPK